MICWHQVIILNRLQIKHTGPFDNLKKWREIVGVKNKEKNGEKQLSNSYKVKREPRLRSFIESVSKKHIQRMKKIAMEQGVTLQRRRAGEIQSDGEEQEYERLN